MNIKLFLTRVYEYELEINIADTIDISIECYRQEVH